MNSDREYLELAAKAAGINAVLEFNFTSDGASSGLCKCGLWNRDDGGIWNPLTDDGDALRLAVKLRFEIKDFAPHDEADVTQAPPDAALFGMVEVGRESDEDPLYVEYYKAGSDRYATTRYAIVRAAAELGRVIP